MMKRLKIGFTDCWQIIRIFIVLSFIIILYMVFNTHGKLWQWCLEWPYINQNMIHYSGNDCENETDACQETPCSLNRTCIDLSPKEEILLGRGYNCSACPLGYDEIDSSCTGRFLTILPYKLNFFAICYKIRFTRTDRIVFWYYALGNYIWSSIQRPSLYDWNIADTA